MSDETFPLVYTVKEAAHRLRIGRDLVYRHIREGRLIAKKDGRRTLITFKSMVALVDALPALSAQDLAERRPVAKRKTAPAPA